MVFQPSTYDDRRILLRMVCAMPTDDWYVLHLLDGRYAAFWIQGLDTDLATSVANGDYESACPFIGPSVQDVLAYIEYDESNSPHA